MRQRHHTTPTLTTGRRREWNVPRRASGPRQALGMNGGAIMGLEKTCPQKPYRSVEYDKHLCYIEAQDLYPDDCNRSAILSALTAHPRYRCERCDRVARRRRSLCRPTLL